MKFTDLKTETRATEPCELLSAYEAHEEQGGTLREFLYQFDFETLEQIRKAVWTLMDRAANDLFYVSNEKKLTGRQMSIHSRFLKIDRSARDRDNFPESIASEIWNGGYSRKRLDENTKALFATKPDPNQFEIARATIQSEYQLSDNDMEKLHFFVEQVKAGRSFPNSLRRMLYIWGDKKKTGKTTSASCIVEILNAYTGPYTEASGYTTTLSNEMQIGGFKVPLISSCNVCLMDECFYQDMGKTYADFKRFMTSSDGRARLPYGQEFVWKGLPNYVATSNDGLRKFIKDWNDRRFLSIEFANKPKTEIRDFDTIKALWMEYIVNSQRTRDWMDWSNDIAGIADETGERSEHSEEFAQELRQNAFITYLLGRDVDAKRAGENNKIYLKFFVDYFYTNTGLTVAKMRGEIEKAVLEVYGPKYSTQNYWLLPDLQDVARRIRNGETIDHTQQDERLDEYEETPF